MRVYKSINACTVAGKLITAYTQTCKGLWGLVGQNTGSSSLVPRPHPVILKVIRAGVGFGSGTETMAAQARDSVYTSWLFTFLYCLSYPHYVGLLHTLTGRRRLSSQGLRNHWADQSVAVAAPGRGVGWSYSPAQLFEGGDTTYRKIQQYIHVPFTTNLIIFLIQLQK